MCARAITPSSLVDISVALGEIDLVNVDRDYDTSRYHLKNIGM